MLLSQAITQLVGIDLQVLTNDPCALTEQAKQQLMENLRDFSSRLPAGVEQLGPYMEVVPPRPVARDDPNGYGTIPFNQ